MQALPCNRSPSEADTCCFPSLPKVSQADYLSRLDQASAKHSSTGLWNMSTDTHHMCGIARHTRNRKAPSGVTARHPMAWHRTTRHPSKPNDWTDLSTVFSSVEHSQARKGQGRPYG